MQADPEPIDRVLEWYQPEPGDDFVGEETLDGVSLEQLRAILRPSDDDPEMLQSYEVETEDEARALQQFVRHRIDLREHTYFVAAYQPEP
jgi:hypothetical protein